MAARVKSRCRFAPFYLLIVVVVSSGDIGMIAVVCRVRTKKMIPFPNKKYDVIYADPPWAWGKTPLVDRGAARAVEKEYPTMQPEEIKRLPVARLAKDRAALFL